MREDALQVSGALVERIDIHRFAINFRGVRYTSMKKLLNTLGLGHSIH